jgi:hypothetical protein
VDVAGGDTSRRRIAFGISVAFFYLYHMIITVSDGCKYVARTMIVLQEKG